MGKGTHLRVQPSAPGRAICVVLWLFVASMGRVRRAWAVWVVLGPLRRPQVVRIVLRPFGAVRVVRGSSGVVLGLFTLSSGCSHRPRVVRVVCVVSVSSPCRSRRLYVVHARLGLFASSPGRLCHSSVVHIVLGLFVSSWGCSRRPGGIRVVLGLFASSWGCSHLLARVAPGGVCVGPWCGPVVGSWAPVDAAWWVAWLLTWRGGCGDGGGVAWSWSWSSRRGGFLVLAT